jgi:hypothetical protein
MSPILIILLNTSCEPRYDVTNTNMLTQHYLSFLVILWCCNYCHLPSDFFIQLSIIHDNLSSQVVDKRRYGSSQWMNSSIIHDNICSLIHKKCHPESYHSVTKYHMTLNIIFSVVLCTLMIPPPSLHKLVVDMKTIFYRFKCKLYTIPLESRSRTLFVGFITSNASKITIFSSYEMVPPVCVQ